MKKNAFIKKLIIGKACKQQSSFTRNPSENMTNVPVLFKYYKTLSQGLLIFWFFSFVVFSLQTFNHFLDGKKHQTSFWIQVKVLSLLIRIQDSHKCCSVRGPCCLQQEENCFSVHCLVHLEFSHIQWVWTHFQWAWAFLSASTDVQRMPRCTQI